LSEKGPNPYAPPNAEVAPPPEPTGWRRHGWLALAFYAFLAVGAAVTLAMIAIGRTTFDTPFRAGVAIAAAGTRLLALAGIVRFRQWGVWLAIATFLAAFGLALTSNNEDKTRYALGAVVNAAIVLGLWARKRKEFA